MRIAVMQPYLFPYIGYFQLIHSVEKFILLDDANFIKRGWINRNRILLNGKEHLFSLPIKQASQNRLIFEVELSNEYEIWRIKFLKKIKHAYSKSPNYIIVKDLIEDILSVNEKRLVYFIKQSIEKICKYCNIKTNLMLNSDVGSNRRLRAEERIIDICKKNGAIEYVNAIGGISLYNPKNFLDHGLMLTFIKSKNIKYMQYKNDFVPSLSIIDVLMFNGKKRIAKYISQYVFTEGRA